MGRTALAVADQRPAPPLPLIAQDQVATKPLSGVETALAVTDQQHAPKLPLIAQDQIATRPLSGAETALAVADQQPAPKLPLIAQDQIATRPLSVPEVARADVDQRPAPPLPMVAQDQIATRTGGDPQAADVTSPPPSPKSRQNSTPWRWRPNPSRFRAVRPPAISAQSADGTSAAQFAAGSHRKSGNQGSPNQQHRSARPHTDQRTTGRERPVVDGHAIERMLAGLLDDIPRVDALAGLQPAARIADGGTPINSASPPEDAARVAPTRPPPDMDATTRKLADLLRQVPQPEWSRGGLHQQRTQPADPDFVAHQNTTSVVESLSGPAMRTDVDWVKPGSRHRIRARRIHSARIVSAASAA